MLNRRSLLCGASTAALFGLAGQVADARPVHGGAAASGGGGLPNLTAVITFPGGTPAGGPFTFDIANGTDMGSYVAPTAGFTQRCIRVRNAGMPNFLVDFRPDVSGGRIEVVFWNGECDPANPTNIPSGYTNNLAAYTAVVNQNGTPLPDFMSVTTRSIPYHNWGARWRFRTVQNRAIIRTASQIFSDGWLPPMSTAAARLSGNNTSTGKPWSGLPYSDVASGGFAIVPPAPPLLSSSNMGTIGASTPYNTGPNGPIYEPFMQATGSDLIVGALKGQDAGGRKQEEGMISEWVADYLFNNTASSLNTILQQAELCGSQMNSWYLPDVATGACPNAKQDLTHYKTSVLATLPDASWYQVPANKTPSPNTIQAANADSHSETWFYIQYALTEDPYFLEGIQYQQFYGVSYDSFSRHGDGRANIGNLMSDPTGQTGLNGPYTCWSYPAECRNLGWGIKNLAHGWQMSPTSPPSWLLSKAVYAAYSSDYSVVGKKLIIDSTDTMNATFKYYMIMSSGAVGQSQADYYQNFEQTYTIIAQAVAKFLSVPTPQVGGQIVPPGWDTHADYSFGMLRTQFKATNTTDQFSIAGWNRQVPLIHDLAGSMFSDKFGANPLADCPTSTAFSDNPITLSGYGCVTTVSGEWALLGPTTQGGGGTPTFPTAAFSGSQQDASMQNVNWEAAAAACCKSIGITDAAAIFTYLNTQFIDYNWPNAADAQLGVPMYMRAGFSGA